LRNCLALVSSMPPQLTEHVSRFLTASTCQDSKSDPLTEGSKFRPKTILRSRLRVATTPCFLHHNSWTCCKAWASWSFPPKQYHELSRHLVNPSDKNTSHPVASCQVKASMSTSCLLCYFLLEFQVRLMPLCRSLVSTLLLSLCEHCRPCLRTLDNLEARLYVPYFEAVIWGILLAWVTHRLGWEFEHSATDLGHCSTRRR
jgi:hypothetical protein